MWLLWGTRLGLVLYLAGLGPGATRVTSGIEAWLGLVRHRLPSSTAAEFDHAAQPSSEQLCEGRSEVGAGGWQWASQPGRQSSRAGSGMDISLSMVAKEAHQGLDGLPMPMPHKVAKKHKKAVLFFEVEILDAKTREKLCFLDKVGLWPWWWSAKSLSPGSSQL